MSAENLPLPQIWSRIASEAKNRVTNRSFWETIEKTVPLAMEGDTLIIGLSVRDFNLAGHLHTADHRNTIDRCASDVIGRPVRVRVIEGDTLAEWASTQRRDQAAIAMRERHFEERRSVEAEVQSWDLVYEQVARSYSGCANRQLPQGKARYLADMLYLLSEAVDRLYAAEPSETAERQLARVIDRVSTNADVPSTLVALELERLRAWQRQQQPQ
ncbi:MAG TPA: hypothetical protein VLH79_05995 [Chthonomonadales bacterium]|nr:hypothetical protein [Chthonomonadales bacterium]